MRNISIAEDWRLLFLGSFLLTVSLGLMAGCARAPDPSDLASLVRLSAAPEPGRAGEEYQLQRGDVLDIKFFYTPELNESVTIRPDGRISLQFIGEVEVVGSTPQKLTMTLRERYTGTLVTPEIAVTVKNFAGQKAYVGGEVKNPGLITFDTRPTLLQALIEVGWLTATAEPRNVAIVRNTGENVPAIFLVDVRRWLTKPLESPQVFLQPFDVVYVPKSSVARVGDFVEQYIDRIFLLPLSRLAGFNFVYDLNPIKPRVLE